MNNKIIKVWVYIYNFFTLTFFTNRKSDRPGLGRYRNGTCWHLNL